MSWASLRLAQARRAARKGCTVRDRRIELTPARLRKQKRKPEAYATGCRSVSVAQMFAAGLSDSSHLPNVYQTIRTPPRMLRDKA